MENKNKMRPKIVKTSKLRFLIREIIGLYRYFKARLRYSSHEHPVFISDKSKLAVKQEKNESFKSFFMRVEDIRYDKGKRISKNVKSSSIYFASALEFIPFLISKCGLKSNNKVLDYGSGGLRCGFGLLDYLDQSCYSCADITDDFIKDALKNSFLLSELYRTKKGTFYEIDKDKIPESYFDLIISSYVIHHIPKEELETFLKSVKIYLKNNGLFYFDFLPCTNYFKLNSITFTYPYRIILSTLKKVGFEIVATYGASIIVRKVIN